jgi:hypothetical protein
VRDRGAREDLRRPRDRAQPGREVQRAAAVAVVHGHRLTGVQPDPDRQRQGRVGDGRVDEPPLQLDRGPDRLPGRIEHHEGLVAAELHDRSVARPDGLPRDGGEPAGQESSGLVTALLREDRVAAYVGDQERPDGGVFALAGPDDLGPDSSVIGHVLEV